MPRELGLGLGFQIKYPPLPIVRNGLLSWWRCNEGAGTTIKDFASVEHATITPEDNIIWDNASPDGTPCITPYDGTDNDLVGGLGDIYEMLSGGITIMAAIYSYQDPFNNTRTILARETALAADINYQFCGANGTDELSLSYAGDGLQTYATSDFDVNVNTWYIATVSFTFGTGSSAVIYKNLTACTGAWTSGDGESLPAEAEDQLLGIGMVPGGKSLAWRGRMGDILLYNEALSLDQITQNYNVLRPRYNL